jgi:protein-S-isoprenylcysteine O-methyltransferase Ste14
MKSVRSFLFVAVQFGCIGLLFASGPFIPSRFYLLVPAIFAILLGLWAVTVMRVSKLNIFPDVRAGSSLVRSGPYRILRHPMYLAVIVFSGTLVIEKFSILRVLVLLVLIIDLVIKIEHEEKLLTTNFTDYQEYRHGSWKLIPFLY